MTERIKTGTILIEGKTILPDTLIFDSEGASNGWIVVKHLDRYRLEQKIRNAGWTFFSVRGDFKAGGFGFDVEKTTRKALHQILLRLESESFNCLEVTAIDTNRSLGLIYVSVSARARHIRRSTTTTAPALSAVGSKSEIVPGGKS